MTAGIASQHPLRHSGYTDASAFTVLTPEDEARHVHAVNPTSLSRA